MHSTNTTQSLDVQRPYDWILDETAESPALLCCDWIVRVTSTRPYDWILAVSSGRPVLLH